VTFLLFVDAAEEEWDGLKLILPDGPELLWTAIFFFGLWALMKFVLLPPIISGRDERLARVSAGQDSVSDSESELAQITAAHNERIAAAKAEAAAVIDAARAESDTQRAEAVAAVEDEIAKLRSGAQSEIDAARVTALAGAKGSVSELAVGAASKVLGRNVDLASNQSVIDGFLNGSSS